MAGRGPSAALDRRYRVRGARLITGDGSAPIEDAAFVVENSRITAVGRRGEVAVPTGAARVDLSGKTVMPAIVDAHGHPGFLDAVTGQLSKANFTRENYIDHLERYAYHGIAATISTGTDMGELAYQLRAEIISERRSHSHRRSWPRLSGIRPHGSIQERCALRSDERR